MKNYEEDFEGWCADCVRVADKLTGREIPLRLNAPQRRVAAEMERQRLAGRPIRLILLKARQWGGSTLIEAYMAWMQLCRRTDWHALICAHVKDASASIKGMYSRLLTAYPEARKQPDPKKWQFIPYEKSSWVNWIPARGCRVALASAVAPNSLRGGVYFMAHLSEVAFWGEGDDRSAEEVVRTVCGTVPAVPDSLIVMESTANGRNNYFYREWQRAEQGESDKTPIFVPWHEIEIYRREVATEQEDKVLGSLSDYERRLMESAGLSVGQIAWYHEKRREYPSDEAMMAEFPSTAEEAFATSGRPLFASDGLPQAIGSDEAGIAVPELCILIPGDPEHPHYAGLYGRAGGRIVCCREMTTEERLSGAMELAARWCREADVPLIVGEPVRVSGVSHSRWCVRRAVASGLRLRYDSGESAIARLDGERLGEITDVHRELIESGSVAESDPGVLDRYRSCRRQDLEEYPDILARMLASDLLYPGEGSSALSPGDFIY